MSFYNTGNPVPSIDPRDLDDNAKVLDGFTTSTEDTYVDRLGVERLTLSGVNAVIPAVLSLPGDLANPTDPAKGASLVGFSLSPAAGAVARTARSVLLERVSIKSFGAISSSNPANGLVNRQAFQATINYLSSIGGGEVYVPSGHYFINVAIPVIVPSNITITGVKGQSVIEVDPTTIINNTTRPFPLANSSVFMTGNPVNGYRAGQLTSSTAVDQSTIVRNVHFYGLTLRCNYTHFSLPNNFWLFGIAAYFVHGGSIIDCDVDNMPNTGILSTRGKNNIVRDNIVTNNGFGGVDTASRNGISASGWIDTAQELMCSESMILDGNICNYNKDEGIQFGVVKGLVVSNNTCIGNQDRGLEGDSAFASTLTEAGVGWEIPSDMLVIGNYVDGKYPTGNALWGITVASSNQGRIKICNNIVRNCATRTGISASQNNNGRIEISDNMLENCGPSSGFHQIVAIGEYVSVERNHIYSPGGSGSGVSVQGQAKKISIKDNKIHDSGVINAFSVNLIGDGSVGSYPIGLIDVSNNSCIGTTLSPVSIVINTDATVGMFKLDGNCLLGGNSTANTAEGAVKVTVSAGKVVTFADHIFTGNTFRYAGATRYPFVQSNVTAASIAYAVVAGNMLGDLTIPFGKRAISDPAAFARYYERDNGLNGSNQTYGSVAPTTGTHTQGDFVWNNSPVPGTNMGWVCTASGTPGTWRPWGNIYLQASATYDPPSLNDGDGVTTTIAISGAALGDMAEAGFSNSLQGILVTAYVSSVGNVSVRFQNETGGVIDLASGTLNVKVTKPVT